MSGSGAGAGKREEVEGDDAMVVEDDAMPAVAATDATPTFSRPVTLLLVGAGNRGTIYTTYARENPKLCKVVGVAEPREYARKVTAERHGIAAERVYTCWQDAVKVPRFADAVIITTQDKDHCEPAVAFAKLGYHMLLEKPMAVTIAECCHIVAAVKAAGVMLAVGHVLRYMPYSRLFRELVVSGAIGDVANVQHIEPIGFWHFAHSYVRGNWRKESEGTFMLMAKCCHDIDWLSYITGSKAFARLSSFGSLLNFKAEKKPAGAASRCVDCALATTCPYSATSLYMDQVQSGFTSWPVSVLVDEEPTVENVAHALRTGPYGRCVWESDNDVLDNQVVNMQFTDGATANLTTVAFTKDVCLRHTRVFGTLGELEGDGESVIVHRNFVTGETVKHVAQEAPADTAMRGHRGADYFLMKAFVNAVGTNDASYILSGPDDTLASHLAVFAAEHARRSSTVVQFDAFRAQAVQASGVKPTTGGTAASAGTAAAAGTAAPAGTTAAAAAGASAAVPTSAVAPDGDDDDTDMT